jgi:hypothetical protein
MSCGFGRCLFALVTRKGLGPAGPGAAPHSAAPRERAGMRPRSGDGLRGGGLLVPLGEEGDSEATFFPAVYAEIDFGVEEEGFAFNSIPSLGALAASSAAPTFCQLFR